MSTTIWNKPVPAATIQPHDHVVDHGTVLWVISPMAPGVHELLPDGGALITFTNQTQIGVANDAELNIYRATPEDEVPCPARDSRGIGCVYREGHDLTVFSHRFDL